MLLLGPAFAQAEHLPWEIAPYRTLVWIETLQNCHLDAAFFKRFVNTLDDQRYATSGSVLATDMQRAPMPLARWFAGDLASSSFVSRLENRDLKVDDYDRIQLISIERDGDWTITFREFDTLTRTWGSVHRSSVRQQSLLSTAILRIIYEKFAALAKITDVEKPSVSLALKATTLIEEENHTRERRLLDGMTFSWPVEDFDWKKPPVLGPSVVSDAGRLPGSMSVGEALQPILRRNDRQGNLVPSNGIMVMPWTYVRCDVNDGLQFKGTMISGYTQPLPGRRNVRTQRLALGVQPAYDATDLKLVDKSTDATALAGYEIYSKEPSGPNLLGASDARGNVRISRDPHSAVRALYVRSGGNLLARLPVVPGHEPLVTARIPNDSPRLLAEGFVEGWRDQLVETMARRQILAQRVQRKIELGELDDAEKWLAELQSGRTVNELAFELRSAKGQFLKENHLDPMIKHRIDELFEKGQRLVTQDKSLLIEGKLAKQLEEAQKAQR
ncbi:hypothetical protein [Bremerella alba]|uniref:Uncharacterized protein n=1 Tax=Bremerella alba TaxID=980252 RepID=A0A7V8V4T0_9BACT|nr:hypothetical protein [Bremerella alba]MBA2114825.1 hypothetical protein [Bremerella alba]